MPGAHPLTVMPRALSSSASAGVIASAPETVRIAPPCAQPARRLPVDDRGAAHGRVGDDVDVPERRRGLHEQALDVERVGHVGAHRERRAVRADDRLDRGLGLGLVVEVDDDDRVAARSRAWPPARGRPRTSRR